jgi:hypothetical protein
MQNPMAGIKRIMLTRGVRAAVPFARLFGITTPELFIAIFLK